MASTEDSQPQVVILMATYNGASYLGEQIKSIFAQSYWNWRLIVRDDCSQDATTKILADFSRDYPERIRVVPPNGARLGADGNFSRLLELADSNYIMFCDQDDIWLPDKIGLTMKRMRELEAENGTTTPLLVHTDMRVVDSQARELCDSVWRYGNHDPRLGAKLNRALVQNMVYGCAVMINAPLRNVAVPIPSDIVQYDWWLALVAVCLGRIAHVNEPTALYRQHGDNTVGVRGWGISYVLNKISHLRDSPNGPLAKLLAGQRQAGVLLGRFGDRLSSEDRERLLAYAELSNIGFFSRRRVLIKYRFFKKGVIRNVGLFAFV
jgi:glycosyltransferase involved in cell wall biosynthesis